MADQPYYAHPSAIIDAGAQIGTGTKIWHFTHVMPGSVIGKNCSLGQNVVMSSRAKMGDGCKIQNNVSLYDDVELEDYVFCGPSMVFTNVLNPRAHIVRKHEYRRTLVRTGASIGANAVIVCGHTVGRYAFVGSGSVVTRPVPNYGLVFGNPARLHGFVCPCGGRLHAQARQADTVSTQCVVCGRTIGLPLQDWERIE